ncbi:MAG: hypothetical protein R2822_18065 [Spirosomataceae bacterium]
MALLETVKVFELKNGKETYGAIISGEHYFSILTTEILKKGKVWQGSCNFGYGKIMCGK